MSLHGKLNVKIFLMFIVAENTGSVNILYLTIARQTDFVDIFDFFLCIFIMYSSNCSFFLDSREYVLSPF